MPSSARGSVGSWDESSSSARAGLRGMGYASQEAALRPSPVTPSSDDIVQQAYTLGGESRYQVSPQEALQWVERNMEGQPLEHKAAWIEARNRVAARASNRAPSYNR